MAREPAPGLITDAEGRESDHDHWFRAQVEAGIREADAPDTVWVDHDTVLQELEELRKTWRRGEPQERDVA